MKVLVIGATGFTGSVVAAAFARAGHEVGALQRPGGRPVPSAYRAVPGDLADPASLIAAATGFDLVLHVGAILSEEIDVPAVDALLAGGVPLIYTSSVDTLGPGFVTEDSLPDPHPVVGWRDVVERRVLAAGGRMIRPGLIYGEGGGVVVDMLTPLAARVGAGVYIGEPGVRWAAVHVEDLAELFLLVAELAPPASVWHAVTETVTVDAIAAAMGNGTAVSWPEDDEPPFEIAVIAGLFRYDQDVSAEKTRQKLGWRPVHTSLIEYLAGAAR
jgi:nucleoside-diphosphate-sugar epimerase